MKTDDADKKYLYSELTQKIIGAIFKIYNELGFGYREKEYQRALEAEFNSLGLNYKKELYSNLKYNDKVISGFYVDFEINDKVILELKVANDIYKKHFDQIMTYLKNHNRQLGLLAVFTKEKVLIKRIINQYQRNLR